MNYDEDIVIVVHVYTRRKHLPQISSKLDEKQSPFNVKSVKVLFRSLCYTNQ